MRQMIGIQMPHPPSLAGLDRQKRNQLAQRWVIHVHLTVQFLSQSLIQFIAHAVYEGRVQKAQYYLEGIMCAECRNNAGRDKSNSARISSVSSVPSASVGPLPGRRLTVPESENVPWVDALGLLAWLSAIALDCEAIPGKFPTRYVSRIPTVQETMDLRALS
jgi:hypothetical protein